MTFNVNHAVGVLVLGALLLLLAIRLGFRGLVNTV